MDINSFWTNSIWYISLAALSLGLLLFVLFKSKNKKRNLGFFFAIMGLAFIIETVIYIFLRAYEYYPLIIPFSPKNDAVIGNIISQLSISTAALLVCVFDISFIGIIISGIVFFFIDILFVMLGIYEHYWYKSWYTLAGVIILFTLIKRWYESIIESRGRNPHYFTIILGVLTLYLPTTNWIGILSGFVVFKEDILIDPFISHAIIAIPKYLFLINMVYLLQKHRARWFWNAAFVALMLLIDAALYYGRLIYVKEGWLFIYSGLSIFTAYLYVSIMNSLIYSGGRYRR